MVRTPARQFFSAPAWIVLVSAFEDAQATTADWVGRVTNASGAATPGAYVLTRNFSSGAKRRQGIAPIVGAGQEWRTEEARRPGTAVECPAFGVPFMCSASGLACINTAG